MISKSSSLNLHIDYTSLRHETQLFLYILKSKWANTFLTRYISSIPMPTCFYRNWSRTTCYLGQTLLPLTLICQFFTYSSVQYMYLNNLYLLSLTDQTTKWGCQPWQALAISLESPPSREALWMNLFPTQ